MSAFDLERAAQKWRQQMWSSGIKCSRTLVELEAHLREEVEHQISLGLDGRQAFEEAVQRLGETGRLVAEFKKVESPTQTMKTPIRFFSLTGWLIPTAIAGIYFSRWITEIVIPTLKGRDFNQLYDSYNVPYLHATMWAVLVAFAWVATIALWFAKKQSLEKQ